MAGTAPNVYVSIAGVDPAICAEINERGNHVDGDGDPVIPTLGDGVYGCNAADTTSPGTFYMRY